MSATTILLAEDSPADVLLIQRAVRKASVADPIEVVGDGDQAVAYLAGEGAFADRARFPLPGLLLLDLKLPRRSGFEVLAWLRAQPGLRRLPVVVLTSSRLSADVNQAYDLGANGYLVKPVSLAEFTSMLGRVHAFWAMTEPPDLAKGAAP